MNTQAPRVGFTTILGAVMMGLGILVLARLLVRGGEPLTPSPWLDLLFAAFFLVRGGMHLRRRQARPRY